VDLENHLQIDAISPSERPLQRGGPLALEKLISRRFEKIFPAPKDHLCASKSPSVVKMGSSAKKKREKKKDFQVWRSFSSILRRELTSL
jgi:hypothetical protein